MTLFDPCDLSAHPRDRQKAGINPGRNQNKRTKHPGWSPGTSDQAACEAAPAQQPRQSTCETRASHCCRPSNSRQVLFQNYELAFVKGHSGQNYYYYFDYFNGFNYFNCKSIVTSSRLKRLSFPCLMSGTGHQRTCTRLYLNIPDLLKKAAASLPVKRQVKEDKTPTPYFPGYSLYHYCPY